MKESDPVGWATQTSTETSTRPSSRHAEAMATRSSDEFSGAEYLDAFQNEIDRGY